MKRRRSLRRQNARIFLWDEAPPPEEYVLNWKTLNYPRPPKCPRCKSTNSLIGDGWYKRWYRDHVEQIGIYRWQCKRCLQKVAVMPAWFASNVCENIATIETAIRARESGLSWANVKEKRGYPKHHISVFNTGVADSSAMGVELPTARKYHPHNLCFDRLSFSWEDRLHENQKGKS